MTNLLLLMSPGNLLSPLNHLSSSVFPQWGFSETNPSIKRAYEMPTVGVISYSAPTVLAEVLGICTDTDYNALVWEKTKAEWVKGDNRQINLSMEVIYRPPGRAGRALCDQPINLATWKEVIDTPSILSGVFGAGQKAFWQILYEWLIKKLTISFFSLSLFFFKWHNGSKCSGFHIQFNDADMFAQGLLLLRFHAKSSHIASCSCQTTHNLKWHSSGRE